MEATKIYTPEVILSYPHLFSPRTETDDNGADKVRYSTSMIAPKGADLTEMKKAVIAVAKEEWGPKAVEMIKKGQIRMPFRTDWEAKDGYPEGCTFFAAKSKHRPGIVRNVIDPTTGKRPLVTDPAAVYPGVVAVVHVRPYAYDMKGKGVGFALYNICLMRDGARIDGIVDARDDFDDLDASELGDFGASEAVEETAGGHDSPRPAPLRGGVQGHTGGRVNSPDVDGGEDALLELLG